MRIEFLTHDDPLYTLPFFEEFVPRYGAEFEILQVSACRAMGKRSRGRLVKELLSLYGPLGFTRLAARLAAASVLGKLPWRRGASRFFTLEQLCRAHGIPYRRIGNPNAPDFVAAVAARRAQVVVSVACPYVLKGELLAAPLQGCVNIHHAPLPRYRGMMPTFWQMFHGESKAGITVHLMSARLDEGAALVQDELTIEPGESLDHLIRRSKRRGAACMAEALRRMRSGRASATPLDVEEGSYFTFPTIAEIREFHRRGLRAL